MLIVTRNLIMCVRVNKCTVVMLTTTLKLVNEQPSGEERSEVALGPWAHLASAGGEIYPPIDHDSPNWQTHRPKTASHHTEMVRLTLHSHVSGVCLGSENEGLRPIFYQTGKSGS